MPGTFLGFEVHCWLVWLAVVWSGMCLGPATEMQKLEVGGMLDVINSRVIDSALGSRSKTRR
jgi:hypothetical protein